MHPTFRWQSEAPVVTVGDMRAWDVLLSGPVVIGVDAETRLHDIQAIQRRTALKRRDGAVDRVLLVVADTRHNRRVLDEHAIALPARSLRARGQRSRTSHGVSTLEPTASCWSPAVNRGATTRRT